ncbi:MAG TPA: hypothetical protein VF011_18750 [Terriglobales bacterium]
MSSRTRNLHRGSNWLLRQRLRATTVSHYVRETPEETKRRHGDGRAGADEQELTRGFTSP